MAGSEVAPWPTGIGAITLFVEDLAAAKQFYQDVFGLPVTFEDDDSAVFAFGGTLVNLLRDDRGRGAHRARGRGASRGRLALPAHGQRR